MASSNDDPDVIMFMARFHALHDLIGDNVDSLYLCAGEGDARTSRRRAFSSSRLWHFLAPRSGATLNF